MIDYKQYTPPIDDLVNISTAGKGTIVLPDNRVQLRAVGRALAQAQIWRYVNARVEAHDNEIIVTTKHEARHITWMERDLSEEQDLWPNVPLPSLYMVNKVGLVYTILVNDDGEERISKRHSERQLARFYHDQHDIGLHPQHPLWIEPPFELPKDYIAAVMLHHWYYGSRQGAAVAIRPDSTTTAGEICEWLTVFYHSELRLMFEGLKTETEEQRRKRLLKLERR